MGLDVVAISQAVWMGKEDQPAEEEDDENFWLPYFPDKGSRCEGLRRGYYVAGGVQYGFRAATYRGYRHWVNELCMLALGCDCREIWEHPGRYKAMAFFELINKPLGVGPTFGPITSEKLYRDFAAHARRARRHFSKPRQPETMNPAGAESNVDAENIDMSWMWEVYCDFRTAFRIARDSGFVYFG